MQGPLQCDFPVNEGGLDITLQATQLRSAEGGRLNTTLFTPGSPHSRTYPKYLVITILQNPASSKWIPHVPKPLTVECQLWRDHSYKPQGDGVQDLTRWKQESMTASVISDESPVNHALATAGTDSISTWVETSAKMATSDPFAVIEDRAENKDLQQPGQDPSPRKRYVKVRKAKGLSTIENEMGNTASVSSLPIITERSLSGANSASYTAEERQSLPSDDLSDANRVNKIHVLREGLHPLPTRLNQPPSIRPPVMPKSSISSISPVQGSDNGSIENPGRWQAWQKSTVQGHRLNRALVDFSGLAQRAGVVTRAGQQAANPKFASTRVDTQKEFQSTTLSGDHSNPASFLIDVGNDTQDDHRPPTTSRETVHPLLSTPGQSHDGGANVEIVHGPLELMDFDEVGATQQTALESFNASVRSSEDKKSDDDLMSFGEEIVQHVGEMEIRQLRQTMNQQKSNSRDNRLSQDESALEGFEVALTDILRLLPNFQGPVRFEVDIGRLLLNGVNQDFRKPHFSANEWPSVFSTISQTVFTEIVTTSCADVDFILGLKLPSSRKLFNATPYGHRIMYVFACRTREDDEVIVEVDEEGQAKIQDTKVLVGAMNWHFPKRLWDARLAVEAASCLQLHGQYEEAAKGIVDNLLVFPSADGQLDIYTKTTNKDLRIKEIFVRRSTCHSTAIYPDLVLHLTEIQNLIIDGQSGSKQHYHATAKSPDEMIASGNRLWWEASLSSITVDEILRENNALELGEKANWTPEAIIDSGVVKNLYGLAKDLVTRIDSVGANNTGPKWNFSHGATKTMASKKPTMEDVSYW